MEAYATIARRLATAFLAGDLNVAGLVDRGSLVLGKRWRWLRPLARRVVETFFGQTRPRQITVTRFILADRGFRRAWLANELQAAAFLSGPPPMCPVAAAQSWAVPPIVTGGELADWLNISGGELDWFADVRALEGKSNEGRLRHYHYRALTKRFGQIRLIESPKPRLKQIQRRILSGILDSIPPHRAAHGFCRGRSIKSFSAPHAGKSIVLRIDLQDFFPSISAARTQALFRAAGYPERVADLVTGLCTNSTPSDAWKQDEGDAADLKSRQARWRYARPHLPQGAPTSPALANLAAYRLDCRLAGLADAAGAAYTRYADDLAFSGPAQFAPGAGRFCLHVCATILGEGFSVHYRKTRIMRQGVRQQLAGLVVNSGLNVRRSDFDRLKATLTNCIRLGPGSQNRKGHHDFRSHLEGRVAFVEMVNPARGGRLRTLFDRIRW